MITDIALTSSAIKAGISAGDIIPQANEQNINAINDLKSLVHSAKPRSQLNRKDINKGKPTPIVVDLPF